MFRLGLTGGIASGKSSVASEFARLGAYIIDADVVARDVVKPGTVALEKIIEHFGEHLLDSATQLNRAKLRQLIFNNPSEKVWLEQLIHPLVRREIEGQLAQPQSMYTILVSPLLFETQQDKLVDRTLVVDIPEDLQIQRAITRDNNSASLVAAIMANQLKRELRLAQADDILDNSGSFSQSRLAIQTLHTHYLDLARAYDC